MKYFTVSFLKRSAVVIALFLLIQLFYMLWLQRLSQRKPVIKIKSEVYKTYHRIIRDLKTLSISDSSGEYRVLQSVSNNSVTHDISLVTQCSINHFYFLYDLVKYWQGPVSVSVYLDGTEFYKSILYISLLMSCHDLLKENVSVHIVFPNIENLTETLPTLSLSINCATAVFVDASTKNYARKKPYPNNLLRNIARQAIGTKYYLLVDIDMLPSPHLRQNTLQYFLKKSPKKLQVFVIPCFEIKENYAIPKNKTELKMLLDKNIVRPFYIELCWKCQKYTDYNKWLELNNTGVVPGYTVSWHDPWEPFYIADTDIPLYDERFKQYGFNRISQVCEVHIVGYEFIILDNVFLIHRGFKTATTFHHDKDEDQNRNRLLFRVFKNELKLKYPQSTRRCY